MQPGLKRSISLLALLPQPVRATILSHLSTFERNKLLNSVVDFGSWNEISRALDSRRRESVLGSVVKAYDLSRTGRRYMASILGFFVALAFLAGSFAFLGPDGFVGFFVTLGYFPFLVAFILLIIENGSAFSFRFNITNMRAFPRHMAEGLLGALLLVILLFQINAFENRGFASGLYGPEAICAIGFAPLFEELFYRFLIMNMLLRKAHWAVRLLTGSVLFAAAHFPFVNPLTFGLYFLAGIVLGLLFVIEQYLFPSLVAHSVANAVIFLTG